VSDDRTILLHLDDPKALIRLYDNGLMAPSFTADNESRNCIFNLLSLSWPPSPDSSCVPYLHPHPSHTHSPPFFCPIFVVPVTNFTSTVFLYLERALQSVIPISTCFIVYCFWACFNVALVILSYRSWRRASVDLMARPVFVRSNGWRYVIKCA
jgi:hypothetical protein